MPAPPPCPLQHLNTHKCQLCTQAHLETHKCPPCRKEHIDNHRCPSPPLTQSTCTRYHFDPSTPDNLSEILEHQCEETPPTSNLTREIYETSDLFHKIEILLNLKIPPTTPAKSPGRVEMSKTSNISLHEALQAISSAHRKLIPDKEYAIPPLTKRDTQIPELSQATSKHQRTDSAIHPPPAQTTTLSEQPPSPTRQKRQPPISLFNALAPTRERRNHTEEGKAELTAANLRRESRVATLHDSTSRSNSIAPHDLPQARNLNELQAQYKDSTFQRKRSENVELAYRATSPPQAKRRGSTATEVSGMEGPPSTVSSFPSYEDEATTRGTLAYHKANHNSRHRSKNCAHCENEFRHRINFFAT